MNWKRQLAAFVVVGLTQISGPAWSAEKTFADYWNEANSNPNKTVKEFPTVIVIMTDRIVYYFTRPGRPEHPGVITRMAVTRDGATDMETDGHSFGPDSAQPAFKAWMNNPWAPQTNSN